MYAVFEKVYVELDYLLTFVSAHKTLKDAITHKKLLEDNSNHYGIDSGGYFVSELFDGCTYIDVWKDDKIKY